MSPQSEQALENLLVAQLQQLGYAPVSIPDEAALLSNLHAQLAAFNGSQYSPTEFKSILNQLSKGNVFERAKVLRTTHSYLRDDGTTGYFDLFDQENIAANRFQVTQQVSIQGLNRNRYDVTLLMNGLPVVQIELKRRGLEMKEAFKQIARYTRDSFGANAGLFQFLQLFVISNGVNTKYFCNNPIVSLNPRQTFFWADVNNRHITDLHKFAAAFLQPAHLGRMLAHYIVPNETHRILMVLRPYQFYAVEAILEQVRSSTENGYIWHTTGSGKTLTSFKASQVVTALPEVHKVVFVVDRKDLDYQTMKEFNKFKKDSVDATTNTRGLVAQLKDTSRDTSLVVTTIQKLNHAIKSQRHQQQIAHLKLARIVFIFDECHRSQFGETHARIVGFFRNSQLFGFTGTPIFADNAYGGVLNKRTTADLFGKRLHDYVISDAIRDGNVLKFNIEYIGRYHARGLDLKDKKVEDIDRKEVLESPERLEKIVDFIIEKHDIKTRQRMYSAMYAVSSIEVLIKVYELFAAKKAAGAHDLRIATIYSWAPNPDDPDTRGMLPAEPQPADFRAVAEPQAAYGTDPRPREKLEAFIQDYNVMYGQNFTTRDPKRFDGYYKDLSRRLKERELDKALDKDRLDILLVVNMFLTGFDAKMVNTMYVDKNLKQHGLVQAFSRTNRIIDERKSQGEIVCFRNLKAATDEAIALFSDKGAEEVVFSPSYDELVAGFNKAFGKLMTLTPTLESVTDLPHEDAELEFVQAFRDLMRLRNALLTRIDFTWDDLAMSEQMFNNFAGKYGDLNDKARMNARNPDKVSVLEEVDFEVELIHRDEINVAYILRLLAKLRQEKAEDFEARKQEILDLVAGEISLRSKRDLIERFIQENLPHIDDLDLIEDDFLQFWRDQKVMALQAMCVEEGLDEAQFRALIDTYMFSGRVPLLDDVLDCLAERPSFLQSRSIGQRIQEKMRHFVEVFMTGVG